MRLIKSVQTTKGLKLYTSYVLRQLSVPASKYFVSAASFFRDSWNK